MDILHIEARYKETFTLPEHFIKKLPKKLILFTTIQFMNSLDNIRIQLKTHGIETELTNMRHTCHTGQILGCSNTPIRQNGDLLYIGDGLFHPKALLLKNDRTVYAYNPKSQKDSIITRIDTDKMLRKIKANYIKFITSKNIGVLITLKPGQNKEYMTRKLEKQYPDKTFYYFLDNTYNFQSLLDFPFIDVFLNTMCERIGYDDMTEQNIKIINLEDIYHIQLGKMLLP